MLVRPMLNYHDLTLECQHSSEKISNPKPNTTAQLKSNNLSVVDSPLPFLPRFPRLAVDVLIELSYRRTVV
jgi:hypothetical protein